MNVYFDLSTNNTHYIMKYGDVQSKGLMISKRNNLVNYIKLLKKDDNNIINIIKDGFYYFRVFENENLEIFFNEKTITLIILDYVKNVIIEIDGNDEKIEDVESFFIEEMKKNNISNDDIDEYIERAIF